MRNFDLILNDGNLDPLTFWKAVHFENVGHFCSSMFVSISGLNFTLVLLKTLQHKIANNSYQTHFIE